MSSPNAVTRRNRILDPHGVRRSVTAEQVAHDAHDAETKGVVEAGGMRQAFGTKRVASPRPFRRSGHSLADGPQECPDFVDAVCDHPEAE